MVIKNYITVSSAVAVEIHERRKHIEDFKIPSRGAEAWVVKKGKPSAFG